MFRLVGPEYFRIGRYECKIDVEPNGTFGLVYGLYINGIETEQFLEANKKKWVTWNVEFSSGNTHHILFGIDTIKSYILLLP